MACKFRYGELSAHSVYIEERDTDRWAIVRDSSTLNTDFEWEFERIPSGRAEDYLKRNRYSLIEAKEHLIRAIKFGKLD